MSAAAARPFRPTELKSARPALAVYLSSHGYGHFTRTAWFLSRLLERRPCVLDVVAPYEATAWPAAPRAAVRSWRTLATDVGVVQSDELAVDLTATRAAFEPWQRAYDDRVDAEAARLREADAVLGDVPPLAFDAASEAGVPAFALANFSWDWIYARMGFEDAARRAAGAYGSAEALFELTPAAPMPAFRHKLELGVLSRPDPSDRGRVREVLGIEAGQRLVLVAFRSHRICRLCEPRPGIRYVRLDGAAEAGRVDVLRNHQTLSFPDLLAAADVVVAKAGYGIVADCAVGATPLLYVLRDGFPEDEILSRWLRAQPWAREVRTDSLVCGDWSHDLERLLEIPRAEARARAADADGVEVAIDLVGRALG